MSDPLFAHAAIIGLGQMGASLGLALSETGRIGTLSGYDPNPDHAHKAHELGAVTWLASDAADCVSDADLVIFCMPVGLYAATTRKLAKHFKEGAILTDIGSIKTQAIRDIASHLPAHVTFIPSHPIAGSERVGPYHASADFFAHHLFLITPIEGTPPDQVEPIAALWAAIGSRVDLLTPELHDQIYAYMSHLPQLIAFAAMPVLRHRPVVIREEDVLFSRFIRIGRSDPVMWRDVFLENAEFIQTAAANLSTILSHMRDELLLGSARETPTELDIPIERLCKTIWPRMLASALVVSVQLVESQLQMKLLRYAAGGFTDVACPAAEGEDTDFEAVSNHPGFMIAMLNDYLEYQQAILSAIEQRDEETLLSLLMDSQNCGKALIA